MNIHVEYNKNDFKTMLILQMMENIEQAYKDAGSAWNDDFERGLMQTIYNGLGEWQAVIENTTKRTNK